MSENNPRPQEPTGEGVPANIPQTPASPMISPESIGPFAKFCCTLGMIPSSYKVSMTYEEQLMWLCNYLENTIIPTVNNNSEATQEIQTLFVELSNYVANYFDNLDVQNEINNKLDTMAEDGTLMSLIGPYLQPYINSQNARITQLENYVASTVNINPLVASSTSEMTDTTRIYVNTTNGYWYYYDGTEWLQGGLYQSAEDSTTVDYLSQEVERLENILYYKNILNEDIIEGYRLNRTNGSEVEDANFNVSDFLPCNTGDKIQLDGLIDCVCFYNINHVLIPAIPIQTDLTNPSITVASNPNNPPKFFRFAWNITNSLNINVIAYSLDEVVVNPNKVTFKSQSINGDAVVTDSTLDIQGVPADSKAVGDSIDAINENITDINSEILDLSDFPDILYYNEILEDNIIEGHRLNRTTGGEVEDENFDVSDFIPVNIGDKFKINAYVDALCYYNVNKQSLYQSIPTERNLTNPKITVPENPNSQTNVPKYMRFAWNTSNSLNANVKAYTLDNITVYPKKVTFESQAINGDAIVTDDTLTVEHFPADSKAVGDALDNITNNFLLVDLSHKTSNIFKKVFCVGDSYTSGYIKLPNQESVKTNLEFAWPHYLSVISGNNWINGGASGSNTSNWWTNRGYLATQSGPVQAYVIGLMINDVAQVTLGSSSDIGTEADTYYGNMSRIIDRLLLISPDAKIFLNGCPKEGSDFRTYENALKDIEAYYQNLGTPVYFIDLYAYKFLYNMPSFTGDALSGHYSAIGYQQMAQIYQYILSDYINSHISDFQDVAFIDYGNN